MTDPIEIIDNCSDYTVVEARHALADALKLLRDENAQLRFLLDKLRENNRELYADNQIMRESLGA